MKNVVFDVDGVLADWSSGFSKLARALFPHVSHLIPVVSHHERQSWDDYPGMTPEMVKVTWDHVHSYPSFWATLPSFLTDKDGHRISRLIDNGYRVYFATNRKTPGALEATRAWLHLRISYDVNVIITHRKGEFCKVVDADYYIDDKSENVDCVIWMTDKKTKSYVLTRPYNSGVYAPHSKSARRVDTVSQFLEDIENEI